MFPIFEHFQDGKDLYDRMVMPVCREFELTYMEFTVLMFLANNPKFDTAAQIAKVRRLTKSHVSVSLKHLQERGLVKGIYHPGNQKRLHLQPTELAEPVVRAGRKVQIAFGETLVRGFTPEEVAQLQLLTNKLHQNMKQGEENNAGQ